MRKISYRREDQSTLDRFIEYLRFRQVLPLISLNTKVLDLGCGYDANFLTKIAKDISLGVGIDLLPKFKFRHSKIKLIKGRVDEKLPLGPNQFDVVSAFAVIEHVRNPKKMLSEARRVLKKDGVLIITTPSQKSKPILEFLAYQLKIISRLEIGDHKRYYNEKSLLNELIEAGFSKGGIKIKRFELGLNLLATAKNN